MCTIGLEPSARGCLSPAYGTRTLGTSCVLSGQDQLCVCMVKSTFSFINYFGSETVFVRCCSMLWENGISSLPSGLFEGLENVQTL